MAGRLTTGDRYKWVALSNTTAAVFMSALDGSCKLNRASVECASNIKALTWDVLCVPCAPATS